MRSLAKRLAARIREFMTRPIVETLQDAPGVPNAAAQIQLHLAYRALVEEKRRLPRFSEVGFKCNSQTDEDGILLFLFSVIGTVNKLCVEICAGDGTECNTANLILRHGWHGLLIDGEMA